MKRIITIIAAIIFGLPALLFAAITVWAYTWTTEYGSKSRDGSKEVRVQTRACFADCVLRITAHQGWSSETLTHRNDCWFQIAHTIWVGEVAVIHIPNNICGEFHLAYNFETGRQVDPKPYEAALRDDIERSYAVTRQELQPCDGDVLKWMSYHERCMYQQGHRALDEFRRRYPR